MVKDEEEGKGDRPGPPAARKTPYKPVNKALQKVKQASGASSGGHSSDSSEPSSEESSSESEDEDSDLIKQKKPRKQVLQEQRAIGSIAGDVWSTYVQSAGSYLYWTLFGLVFGLYRSLWHSQGSDLTAETVGTQVFEVAEAGWLARWSRSYSDTSIPPHSIGYWLTIYSILTTVTVLFGALRYLVMYEGSIRASRRLHSSMLKRVFRAPLALFDRTALGTIVNRFAKDQEVLDSQTADHITKTTIYGLGVLTTVATVTAIIPGFLIGFLLLTGGYIYFARLYVHTARELRRLDAVTKSPLFVGTSGPSNSLS